MEFNEKLQELRKLRGLTQGELAQKIFVSRTALVEVNRRISNTRIKFALSVFNQNMEK